MKVRLSVVLVLVGLVVGGVAWWAWPRPQPGAAVGLVGLSEPVSADFARAGRGRAFSFPQDFGAHPDFQTEWWYYTGNLLGMDGRRFGYQLTFFRRALQPASQRVPRSSAWAVEQVYLAHFALTDVQGGQFHYFERFERGAAGLAGALAVPDFQVWLGDWAVNQVGDGAYRLDAQADGIRIGLDLIDRKGPVLQGDQGYSQKGPEPGNASYYVSQTALESRGSVEINGQSMMVTGSSWMDHEFSTSALAADQVGWDWFALQLDDGSELMVYGVRKADGSLDALASGTLIERDGHTRRLAQADFQITVDGSWKSPHSGAVYPAAWRISIPSEQIDLKVVPRLADQELRLSFTYWEGAVGVTGTRAGKAVSGSGYVELTGYAGSMQGQF